MLFCLIFDFYANSGYVSETDIALCFRFPVLLGFLGSPHVCDFLEGVDPWWGV